MVKEEGDKSQGRSRIKVISTSQHVPVIKQEPLSPGAQTVGDGDQKKGLPAPEVESEYQRLLPSLQRANAQVVSQQIAETQEGPKFMLSLQDQKQYLTKMFNFVVAGKMAHRLCIQLHLPQVMFVQEKVDY